MTVTRMIARPMLASIFVIGGVNAFKNSQALAGMAKPVTDKLTPLLKNVAPSAPIPTDPQTLVKINAVTQVVAAAALATGRTPRLSSAVLAATLVPTTVAGHAYWNETDPAKKSAQKINFFKNVSIVGGLLISSVDTDGKPGVAWRARRAATDVGREARHFRKTARLEAKLAAKNLG